MNLIYPLLLVGILAPQAHAKDNDKVNSAKKQKLAPLSEEFLLFLLSIRSKEILRKEFDNGEFLFLSFRFILLE